MTTAGAAQTGYPSSWDEVEAPGSSSKGHRPWSKRRLSQYELACNLRDGLRAVMGGRCEKCGAEDDLEFHHPKGRNWVAKQKNLAQRMRLYWRDWRAGLLKLFCSGCNKGAGAPMGFWQRAQKGRAR